MITYEASLTGMTKKDFAFIGVLVFVASLFAFSIIRSAERMNFASDDMIKESSVPQQTASVQQSTMSTIPDNTIAGITDITSVSQATLHTSKGDITVAFFSEEAPLTVKNFITLANRGFYDGTRFHRVIKEFMIQGGDPLSKDDALAARWGTGGPGYAFADEINNKKLVKGALAMANAGPNTNGSQFFIVTADETPWLDGKHTVFGNVVAGMDVVMAIEGVSTGASDRPLVPVTIESITLK